MSYDQSSLWAPTGRLSAAVPAALAGPFGLRPVPVGEGR